MQVNLMTKERFIAENRTLLRDDRTLSEYGSQGRATDTQMYVDTHMH